MNSEPSHGTLTGQAAPSRSCTRQRCHSSGEHATDWVVVLHVAEDLARDAHRPGARLRLALQVRREEECPGHH